MPQQTFYCPDHPLSESISLRIVWTAGDMCEIVGFSKFPRFSRITLRTIVTHEGRRDSMYGKDSTQGCYYTGLSCRCQFLDFHIPV